MREPPQMIHLAGADTATAGVIRSLMKRLPEAAFRTAQESLERRRAEDPPRNEAAYFVGTLQSMIREGQYR